LGCSGLVSIEFKILTFIWIPNLGDINTYLSHCHLVGC
jgi:hypothetical protein